MSCDTIRKIYRDEKVKYDAGDPTAGYVADKIVAGTGISVAEGTGANENKLVITATGGTESDTLQTVTDRGATTTTVSTFSTAIKTPKIYPSADSTTAVQVLKADGTTPVLNIDTTNKRVGVGTTAPMVALHSSDGATVANGIKAFWNDASDIMVSANQPTSGAGVRIAVAHNSTVTSRPVMTFIRTRGTLETPTTVQTDDNLGDVLFGGASSDGSIAYGAGIFAFADGTTAVGSVPTRLSFVTGGNSANRAERLKILSTGEVTVTSTLGVTGATTLNGDLNLTKVNPAIVLTNTGNTAKGRTSIYSASPNSYYHTANAYFDGANWQRDDVTKVAVVFSLEAGFATALSRFRYAAAGANPATLSTAFNVSITGVFQVPKLGAIADSTTAMQFFKADGTTAVMTIDTTNSRVGIGTTAPSAKIHALATTEQLRLSYSAGNEISVTVGATGSTTFALAGTAPTFTFSQGVKVDGLVGVATGVTTKKAQVGGTIKEYFADAGNVTTGETDLYTYTTEASLLATNGNVVRGQYSGTFVASATATRQIKLYFGGTAIFDSGALSSTSAYQWTIDYSIIRVSSTVVRYRVVLSAGGYFLSPYVVVGELTGLTLTNTNILKITGTAAGVGAATNDIVAKMGEVYWSPTSV